MAKNVPISFSGSGLNYAKLALLNVKNGIDRATKNGINNSLAATRKELYNAIKDRYALRTPKTEEKAATKVIRAQHKPFSGAVRYSSKSLPLIKFKTNPNKQPLQKGKRISQRKLLVTEVTRGKPERWPYGFIARMPNGHVGVFTRTGKYTNKRTWAVKTKIRKKKVRGKEIIRQRFSDSIPQMVNTLLEYDNSLKKRLEQIADTKLDEQVNKLLAKG